ncbi:hypothetical protein [Nitrincola iocasae]|uniref:DUF2570 domain-containing protein n=1 Tax=Nitrincola iocasae TaxID=2614693 RepID=A0A5J6LAX5_9GAMM|nr:hypothetical protein [Nitrincola iocasae]QEW05640.1 hypothetical protein F5I99_03570 [Nitrincola iocasae]
MRLSLTLLVGGAALLFVSASHWFAWQAGHQQAQAECQAANADSARTALDQLAEMAQEAHAASKLIYSAQQARDRIDRQTTQELQNVLAQTAHMRAHCEYSNDIMRLVDDARARAAAAASGGTGAAVPGAN